MSTITLREQHEIERANSSGRPPVVFVHGLWLLASSWDPWRRLFESHGYATLAPSWPDEPASVEEAREDPEVFAGKSVQQVTNHFIEVIGALELAPAIIGHSFGGLITQKLAGEGLATAAVAIDPAPFRGVLSLTLAALKVASKALRNPANYNRAVPLTREEFRYGFGNAISQEESDALYETYCVAAAGRPLFQAAAANLNPWTEVSADTTNPERGPLLIVSGGQDHTVPSSMVSAAFRRQQRNPGVTVFREFEDRGHSLILDHGWEQVANLALTFVHEHHPAGAGGQFVEKEPRP
jgi:non-heme chloroperoxidase